MGEAAPRTCVVTGAASGIGAATLAALEGSGARVIGVDLTDVEVIADLGTPAGRAAMVAEVEGICGGRLDAVVACAGTIGRGGTDVAVNYFGATATLAGLRPLLACGDAPRAVGIVSYALVEEIDAALVASCVEEDEPMALSIAGSGTIDPVRIYASTKRALARWVRRNAPSEAWAGCGIALNAVAPGVIRTAMTAPLLDNPDLAELLLATVPMPLGGVAEPSAVANTLAFLVSPQLESVTGQFLFVDGGADCVRRSEDVWA